MTSFAQTEVSAPPIYKLGGNNHAAFLRPGNFLTPKQDAMLKAAKANTPKMKLTSVKRIDSENARITLDVKSDWGKGDGFEVWIDKECEIENDFCDNGVDAYTVFEKSDYVLPEGSTFPKVQHPTRASLHPANRHQSKSLPVFTTSSLSTPRLQRVRLTS